MLAYEQMLIQKKNVGTWRIIIQNLLYYLPVIRQSGLEFIEFLSRFLGVINGKMGNIWTEDWQNQRQLLILVPSWTESIFSTKSLLQVKGPNHTQVGLRTTQHCRLTSSSYVTLLRVLKRNLSVTLRIWCLTFPAIVHATASLCSECCPFSFLSPLGGMPARKSLH